MFGLFTKRCQTCGKAIKEHHYTWRIEGKKVRLCPRCNGQMERRAGLMRFGRGGPPTPETFLERWSGAISNVLIAAMVVAAVFAIGLWRTSPQQQEAVETADAALRKAVKAAAAEKSAMVDNDMLVLESKDGRTIRAQILTISTKDVFIRRDDKKEFRVPLSQLTDASLQKVQTFNTSLSGNVQ